MRTYYKLLFSLFFILAPLSVLSQSTFSEKLEELGINSSNVKDWSDSTEITLPMPTCAYVNITGISQLPPKKTSNYKAWLEIYDGQGNYFKKRILISLQGRSSTSYAKKNYKADFCNDEWLAEDTPDITFGNWVDQDGFHFKAFYFDLYRGLPIMGYYLYDLISSGRGEYGRIWERANIKKPDVNALCHPDAFPCVMYFNNEFYGLYAWQLKKHRKNYNMKKHTAEHIHVDGAMVSQATLFGGTIDWSRIELRNPKDLYCMDGTVYSDENQKEIIDETSPYFDLASDDADTKKNKQMTLQVKNYLHLLGDHYHYLDSMATAGASTAEMRAAVEERFDVPGLIDYIIHNLLTCNSDGLIRNFQWHTWDGMKWTVSPYDLDGCFGYSSDGQTLYLPGYYTTHLLKNRSVSLTTPLGWAYKYFRQDIYDHYAFLRDNGYLNPAIVASLFDDWYQRFGYNNYQDEWTRWPGSFCLKETICNEPWELCEFGQPEYGKLTEYNASVLYHTGDKCKLKHRIFRAKADVQGVRPYKQIGAKDSLERIYSYMQVHMAAVDSWMKYKFTPQLTSYSLDISAAGWTTLCLPFRADVPDGLEFYTVERIGSDGHLVMTQVANPEAHKPYLVKGPQGKYVVTGITEDEEGNGEDYLRNGILKGCYTERYVPQGGYVLQNHNGKVAFYRVKANSNIRIGAYRAWISTDEDANSLPGLFSLGEASTTDIIQHEIQSETPTIYDTNGRRVDNLRKGVNILKYSNGHTQKVVIK